MKKLFFFFSIICLFIACNNDKNKNSPEQGTGLSSTRYTDKDTLKRITDSVAVKMIKHFKDSNKKPKNVLWASFNPLALAKLCSDSNVVSVKFFLGAYLDTEAGEKKNFPTIICQVIRKAALVATPEYYEANEYCPPPYDKDCEVVDAEYSTASSALTSDSVSKTNASNSNKK